MQLSQLSDNQIKMKIKTLDNERVDPRAVWMKIHITAGGKTFTAVNDPEEKGRKNCHIEDGELVIDIPAKELNVGVVGYMIEVREECVCFSDGYKNTLPLGFSLTDIHMV